MPPQTNFSPDAILNEAFEIVRKEGLAALTARKIAQNLKCSTQPVYSSFQSMEELKQAVIAKAIKFTFRYLSQTGEEESPFLNIGLRYFQFACEEQELFRLLFMSGRIGAGSDKIGAPFEPLLANMQQDQHLQGLNEEQLKRIGTDMWIYTHGLISLTFGNIRFDEAYDFIRDRLYRMGRTIIQWEHSQKQHTDRSL